MNAKKFLVGFFGKDDLVWESLKKELGSSEVLRFKALGSGNLSSHGRIELEWFNSDRELVSRILEYNYAKHVFLGNCYHIVLLLNDLESFSVMAAAAKALIEDKIPSLLIIGNIDSEGIISMGEFEEQDAFRSLMEQGRARVEKDFSIPVLRENLAQYGK